MAMFLSARVTVAVSCSFNWLREISVSYSSTRGLTMIDLCGPSTSLFGAYFFSWGGGSPPPSLAFHVFIRGILQRDFRKRRAVVIEEGRSFLLDDLHQAGNAKHIFRLRGASAAADDELARAIGFQTAQHRAERVWLRHAGLVFFRGPGIVGFDRDALAAYQPLQGNRVQRGVDGLLNGIVLGNDNGRHLLLLASYIEIWEARRRRGWTLNYCCSSLPESRYRAPICGSGREQDGA